MSLLTLIINHLFGRRYWANIIVTRGTDRIELSSFIHRTRAAARAHADALANNASFAHVETVSFRSRKQY